MSALALEGVHAGTPTVLEDFSLRVDPAQIVVLSGGIGKFLVFRMALGMLAPSSGSIRTLGLDPGRLGRLELAELRARCALVPHSGALVSNLSVRDNVALPLRYHDRAPAGGVARAVEEALGALDLAHFAELRPAALTYPERRLAGLARARASRPELLLLQDPYEGLELSLRERVSALLEAMVADGCAILITTPVIELDRTHDGRLAARPGLRVVRHQAG